MNFIIITLGLVCGILSGEAVGSFFAICFLTVVFIGFVIRYALGRKPNINRLCTVLAFGIGVVSVNVALSSGTLTDYVDHYCTLPAELPRFLKAPMKIIDIPWIRVQFNMTMKHRRSSKILS